MKRFRFTKKFRAAVAEFANNYGLIETTTARQKKNGTIQLSDPTANVSYTMHQNGYVRRKLVTYRSRNDHYQLNRVKTMWEVTNRWRYSYTERIMATPNEQLGILASAIPSYRNR